MKTIELIQKTIYTIEEELQTEISAYDLAKDIGYSVDHFQRAFKQFVGMPLMVYIKKRRLELALIRIIKGESIMDAALYCGFDTHAGFYKAFKNQYGCSPTKYLKLNKVGPTTPIDLIKESKKIMNKHIMLKILKNWDVPIESKDIDKLDLSNAVRGNHTYRINNDFIFKSDVDINHLHTQIKMGKSLKAYNINAPYPIQTISGEDYVVIEDVYYMLLHFIDGNILTVDEMYNGNCFDLGHRIGTALGKLHLVLKTLEDEIDVTVEDFKDTMMNWALPEGRKLAKQWDLDLPETFFDTLESEIIKNHKLLPTQLIHRDPNPTNYIFKDGEFNGFIDFEISEKNIRIFDVGYALTGLYIDTCKVSHGIDKWLELKLGLLKGYEQINPLTTVEKDMLPYVMLSIQLIFIAYLEGMEGQLDILKRNHIMLEELSKILL